MIVLNGKYGFAKVFLPKDSGDVKNIGGVISDEYKYLDDATHHQIESFLNHPAFQGRKIRIMPDTHAGRGSCVGFTMNLGAEVIPNIIGVDIGCGIMATKLPNKLLGNWDLSTLDNFIRENIPSGFSIRNTAPDLAGDWWNNVCNVSKELGLDTERVAKSVGTLGGGNHFIELGRDEEGFLWLTIHSGSRNFGLQIAKYHQKVADDLCKAFHQDFGDLNFLPSYVGMGYYSNYIDHMKAAQEYAHQNRKLMTRVILDGFFGRGYTEQIDSVHNYINFDDGIIRKGATSAHEGERVVIPFNMRDGLIIGTGLGNEDWNYSAPHGAGRILSRGQAKKQLSLEQAVNDMKDAGIFTTSLSEETLDEASGAYKSAELITEMIKETVHIDSFVKPIYNFKAK